MIRKGKLIFSILMMFVLFCGNIVFTHAKESNGMLSENKADVSVTEVSQETDQNTEENVTLYSYQDENADNFLTRLKNSGILGGIKIDDTRILVCATEMNTEEEILEYINAVK